MPIPDQKILDLCKAEEADLIACTEKVVNMDSGSDDFPEVHAKQAFLMEMLEELGAEVQAVQGAAPRRDAYNVVGTWRGEGKARIMFMNHYDTVWPKGEAARRPFTIRDGVAYGPGVSDSQCNIAALRALCTILFKKLGERNFDRITVLFNCDEERYSSGSKDLIMELAAGHDVVYSLDGGGDNGEHVTISTRGGAYCDLYITGVEAHSGSDPDKGRNAGYEMAHQILNMRDLSDKAEGTDVNWTMGNFGIKSNVIPGNAWAQANIRVRRKEEWDRVERDIAARIADKLIPECEIRMAFTRGRPPFEANPVTEAMLAKAVAICAEIDHPLVGVHSGGGTDSAYSSQKAPALEGLGLGGSGAHSLDEKLPLANIVPRLYLLVRLTLETMAGRVVPVGTRA